MADLETLRINFTADTQSASSNLNKLDKSIDKTNKSSLMGAKAFAGLGTSINKVIGPVLAATAAFLSFRSIMNSFSSGDALGKTADKLGITTEALAGLRHAAEQTAGVTGETLDTALQNMVRRISEASKGMGEAKDALKELGLNAKELAKLSPDQQFKEIAEAMSRVKEQGDRVRLTLRLFDRSSGALVNTLKLGKDALNDFTEEAKSLGIAISRADAAKLEAANDAMDKIQKSLKGLMNQVAIKLAPIIKDISNSIIDFINNIGGIGSVAATALSAFGAAAKAATAALAGLIAANVVTSLSNIGTMLQAAQKAMIALNIAVRANPLAAAVGIITAAATAFALFGDNVTAADRRLKALKNTLEESTSISERMRNAYKNIEIAKIANDSYALASAMEEQNRLRSEAIYQLGLLSKEIKGNDKASNAAGRSVMEIATAMGTGFGRNSRTGIIDTTITIEELRKQIEETTTAINELNGTPVESKETNVLSDLFILGGQSGEEKGKKYGVEFFTGFKSALSTGSFMEYVGIQLENAQLSIQNKLNYLASLQIESMSIDELKSFAEQKIAIENEMHGTLNQQRLAYLENQERMEQQHLQATKMLWETSWQGKAQIVSGILGNLSTLMNTESRKQFEVGKASALAENTINTYLAATKAYQAMAGINPALGIAAAAAATAAGLANHQRIQKTKFGGKSSPSSSGSTSAAASGEATATGGESTTTIQRNISINMIGKSYDQLQVREMIGQINEQVGDNVNIGVA